MDKSQLIEKLRRQGYSENIIGAFDRVRREIFVPERFMGYVYEDIPLLTETGSTVSQPSTIAFMLNLLDPKYGHKILEIGSGSGYLLALVSEIIKNGKIYGLERLRDLAIRSKKKFEKDSNILIINRDGYHGLKEFAPYDRIIVSGAYDKIPYFLLEQLKDPGILVVPVKQSIIKLKKENGEIIEKEFPGFAFVRMVDDSGIV